MCKVGGPMNIDFTKILTDLDDEPILRGGEDEVVNGKLKETSKEPITLAIACETALLANTAETQKLSGDAKVHRAVLAHDIHRKGKVDIIAEDVTLLKNVISEIYAPLIVWRAHALLDPKVTEVKHEASPASIER